MAPRVHDQGMKSSGAEGAYCHGRCSTVRLRIFPVRVHRSLKNFLEMKVRSVLAERSRLGLQLFR